MYAVTPLFTVPQSVALVDAIAQQIKADLPVLLAVLGGITAIYAVTHLLIGFAHDGSSEIYHGSIGGGTVGVDYSGRDKIEKLHDAERETDRELRKTAWVDHVPYRNFHDNPGDGNDREYWYEHKWARW